MYSVHGVIYQTWLTPNLYTKVFIKLILKIFIKMPYYQIP